MCNLCRHDYRRLLTVLCFPGWFPLLSPARLGAALGSKRVARDPRKAAPAASPWFRPLTQALHPAGLATTSDCNCRGQQLQCTLPWLPAGSQAPVPSHWSQYQQTTNCKTLAKPLKLKTYLWTLQIFYVQKHAKHCLTKHCETFMCKMMFVKYCEKQFVKFVDAAKIS